MGQIIIYPAVSLPQGLDTVNSPTFVKSNVGGTVAIPLNNFVKDGAWTTPVDAAPGSSLLGLAAAGGSPLLGNQANGNVKSDYAMVSISLPAWYVSGASIKVRLRAKQATTLSNASSKVDVDFCKVAADSLGSDICTTAAQQVTTSYANYDFTITPTSRVAGDVLLIRVALLNDDTAGTTNTAMSITEAFLVLGSS